MHGFSFRDGQLYCEDVEVSSIADAHGTPTFIYSANAFRAHYRQLADAFAPLNPNVCFSIKSCHNLHVLRTLAECGSHFDAVSIGEVHRAIEAGAHPAHIVFAGVGKTPAEITTAVELQVGAFNAESEMELEVLAMEAERVKKPVRVALRINPDVDAKTHPLTTTGKDENKFGIEMDQARNLFQHFRHRPHLKLSGIHLHIGSPVHSTEPYVEMLTKSLDLIDHLNESGAAITSINIGGGYGVDYGDRPSVCPQDYASAIVPLLANRGLTVSLEPGRSISGNAGILVARAIYLKQSRTKNFVIVDGSMTELIRPALYQGYHFIWPVNPNGGLVPTDRSPAARVEGTKLVDIVGPVCETSDYLGLDRSMPPVKRGDLIAVFSAGAYGAVMSSQYNSRGRAPEVLVDGDTFRLIRRRETYDDLVACERMA